MLNLHIIPNEVGVALTPTGNPLVTGLDKNSGIMVSIEIDSLTWKAFLQNAGRLNVSRVAIPSADEILAVRSANGDG